MLEISFWVTCLLLIVRLTLIFTQLTVYYSHASDCVV